jgi:hypothetical protein
MQLIVDDEHATFRQQARHALAERRVTGNQQHFVLAHDLLLTAISLVSDDLSR